MLHSNLMPSCLSLLDLDVDHAVGQAEVGDAVLEHAAGLVEGLVDRHVAAGLGHVGRAGHARRARTDDADLEAVGLDVGNVGPAFGDRHVADEALEPADRHRLQRLAHRAHAFALVFLRAHAPAHRRQQVGVGDDVVGAVEILALDLLDEAGNVDADRAAAHAGLVGAVQAARGLDQRVFEPVAAGHLVEVLRPHLRRLLGHRRARLREWCGSSSSWPSRAPQWPGAGAAGASLRMRQLSLTALQRRLLGRLVAARGAPSGRRSRPGGRRSRARRRRRT